MLDFPSNPLEGEVYHDPSSDQSWVWTQGAWVFTSAAAAEQVIVDEGAGYQIVGGKMIAWGFAAGDAGGNATISFPKEFASPPEVTITGYGVNTSVGSQLVTGSVTETRAFFRTYNTTTGNGIAANISWIAIGDCLPEGAMPKSVFGGGGGSGGDVPIVDDGAGYQIVGGKMIAWGLVQTGATGTNVSFPKEFGATPSVTLQANTSVSTFGTVQSVGPTGFYAQGRNLSGTQVDIACWWIAQGDCLPEDAMPTTVIGNGVSEYHDPAGAASWRIIGRTLECWGKAATASGLDVLTFPKTFAALPSVSLVHANVVGGTAVVMSVQEGTQTVNGMNVDARRNDNSAGASVAYDWYAIGEVGP